MLDALDLTLREIRINRMNIASITLAVTVGFGILIFQELRLRAMEDKLHRLKKGRT